MLVYGVDAASVTSGKKLCALDSPTEWKYQKSALVGLKITAIARNEYWFCIKNWAACLRYFYSIVVNSEANVETCIKFKNWIFLNHPRKTRLFGNIEENDALKKKILHLENLMPDVVSGDQPIEGAKISINKKGSGKNRSETLSAQLTVESRP